MGRIIGIDLGTTNSLGAVWEDGQSKLIPNAFGEYLTPSVVSIDDDGTVYVGKTAKERLVSHPGNTASVFKRFMGTAKQYMLGGKLYRPEELSAFVLRRIREDAEAYLGEQVEEAIVSVPAYFNDMGRNAVKRAGALAGIKVNRIVNEPSAAALACQNIKQEEETLTMVFDFGGGTLDVSLVECFDNVIEIRAVSGDNQLGGQDFDDALVRHFIKSCQWNLDALTPETKAVLRSSAEKCKRDLTENKSAEMIVNCAQGNKTIQVTRKDLVTMAPDLFERMGKVIKRVLGDVGITPGMINHVVLVGGSCKMPVVQQYLKHILEHTDIEAMNPDYMVALGAGVCAGIKERNEEIRDTLLTDICPFSLGTSVVDRDSRYQKEYMSFIIPRNSVLPCSQQGIYGTVADNQKEIWVPVYQGEAMYPEDNILLGKLTFTIPPRPAGEVYVRVRYTYDINGVLEVEAEIPITGEKKHLVIVNKELGMSQVEIDAKLKEYEELKLHPMELEENRYVLAWGERLFVQCPDEMKKELLTRMKYFRNVMMKDVYRVPKVRKYLMVFLATVEQMLDGYLILDQKEIHEGSWYSDEDEDEKEIDDLFKTWNEEDEKE